MVVTLEFRNEDNFISNLVVWLKCVKVQNIHSHKIKACYLSA